MRIRDETLPLTSTICMPFDGVHVIHDIQFLLKTMGFYTFLKKLLMSNVTLTLKAKTSNFNQKFASTGFKIDEKSIQNRSRKRVRFEVASRCALKSILDQFWVDFGTQNGRVELGKWPSRTGDIDLGTGSGVKLGSKGRSKPFRTRVEPDLG